MDNSLKRLTHLTRGEQIQQILLAVCVTLGISLLPFAQQTGERCLELGFPYAFYTIHVSYTGAVTHYVHIPSLALNLACAYAVVYLLRVAVRWVKSLAARKGEAEESRKAA